MQSVVKICGLQTPQTVEAAIAAGSDWLGFVFYAESARYVSARQTARLTDVVKGRARSVGLFVNPSPAQLADTLRIVDLDMIQLHGTESAAHVSWVKDQFRLPVIKAVGVGAPVDLQQLTQFEGVADYLLLDAKPSEKGLLPGGRGQVFDWSILTKMTCQTPWLLSGGLTPGNVGDAIANGQARSNFAGVDVSSGVETQKGVKNVDSIQQFVTCAKTAMGTTGKRAEGMV